MQFYKAATISRAAAPRKKFSILQYNYSWFFKTYLGKNRKYVHSAEVPEFPVAQILLHSCSFTKRLLYLEPLLREKNFRFCSITTHGFLKHILGKTENMFIQPKFLSFRLRKSCCTHAVLQSGYYISSRCSEKKIFDFAV